MYVRNPRPPPAVSRSQCPPRQIWATTGAPIVTRSPPPRLGARTCALGPRSDDPIGSCSSPAVTSPVRCPLAGIPLTGRFAAVPPSVSEPLQTRPCGSSPAASAGRAGGAPPVAPCASLPPPSSPPHSARPSLHARARAPPSWRSHHPRQDSAAALPAAAQFQAVALPASARQIAPYPIPTPPCHPRLHFPHEPHYFSAPNYPTQQQ